MIRRFGVAAAIAACAALVYGCGGGNAPAQPPDTPLPALVVMSWTPLAEVAEDQDFGTDVPAGATGLRFAWDFGDGNTSTEASPRHRYASAGSYLVQVTVRDGKGHQVTTRGQVQVVPYLRLYGLRCSGTDGSGWCRQSAQDWRPQLHDLALGRGFDAWAVGEDGAVLQTNSLGTNWFDRSFADGHRLSAVVAPDPLRGWILGWASGGEGRAWRTVDGGNTWPAAVSPVPVAFPVRLRVLSDDVVLVWGARPGSAPAITEDGGRSWRLLSMDVQHVEADGTLWGLPVTPEGAFYAEHPGVAFRRSSDLGRSFVAEPGWPADGVVDWMGVSDDGWAWALSSRWVGDFPAQRVYTLLVRRGSAAAWTQASLPASGTVVQLTVTPSGSFAITNQGLAFTERLWHSDDAALTWTSREWPPLDRVAVTGLVDGRTAHASFRRTERPSLTTDGGSTWVRDRPDVGLPDDHQVQSVRRVSQGLLLKSSPAFGPNPRAGWQLSGDGSRWNDLWRASPDLWSAAVTELWFRDRQNGLAVTRGGTVLDTDDGGRNWRARSPAGLPDGGAAPLQRVQVAPDASLWALAGGRLVRSGDNGRSWQDAPSQPPPSQTSTASLQDFGWITAQQLYAVQTACFISPHRPTTCSSTVHRSDDAGRNWRSLPPNACHRVAFASAIQAICLIPDAPATSSDGGLTWTVAPGSLGVHADFPRIARGAPGSAAPGWWVLKPDRLLRSIDDGRSWQAVALPTLPLRLNDDGGIAPVVLRDMDFAGRRGWIVGDEGLVLFSDDGGASWAMQPSGVQSTLNKVFALDADSLWVGADQTVLVTATGGR